MADNLIIPFSLPGLEQAMRHLESEIVRLQNKANQAVKDAGVKRGIWKLQMDPIDVPGVGPVPYTAQVNAEKMYKTSTKLAATQAASKLRSRQQWLEDISEAQEVILPKNIVQDARARVRSKQQWLDDITAVQEAIVPKNTREMAEAKMASKQSWLDDISEAQKQLLVPKKEQLHQAINSRGSWLADLDEAQAKAGQIETARMEHRASRDAQRRYRLQQIEDLKQQRGRNLSHATMGLASAGIGIGGQAAFPLLNVAFASMSGMEYAGIAALATAAGEGARAVMRLQDAATQAAESLGAVGISAKLAKGEYEAAKAFYGVMQQGSQTRMYNERTAALTGGGATAAMPWMMMGNVRTNIANAAYNPMNALTAMSSSWDQTMQDMANLPGTMKEARDSMYRQLMQYQARIEGPEQMWQRIQTAAASPADESRKVAMRQIELMDKQIKALEGNTAALEIMKQLPNPFKGADIVDQLGPIGLGIKAGRLAASYL